MAIKKAVRWDCRIVGTMDEEDGGFYNVTYSRHTRRAKDLWTLEAMCTERMEQEYNRMTRMYWRAKKHGVSWELLEEIRADQTAIYQSMGYPYRILDDMWVAKMNYAFKEGVKHHEVDY